MTVSITHPFVSTVVDLNNPGEVGPGEWNATHTLSGASALTKVDDTNVTLTLGGTPTTALLEPVSLTLGWTGTVAANRLNSSVVQSISNDTNVTGSIVNQILTLGWTGTLGLSRGGLGGSQSAATANQLPVYPGSGGAAVPTTFIPSLISGTSNTVISVNSAGATGSNNIITGQNYLAAMTNSGEAYGYSFRNSTTTGNSVYDAIFPSVTNQDGLQSVLNIPVTATVEGGIAIGGYFTNASATTNAVGLFGVGTCTVDNAAGWGINTLLQDAATRVAGTGTGRVLLNEFDFNVMNPDTQVIGLSVGGNSLAQSSNAIGFIVNSLGTGFKWQTGFYCIDGAVSTYGFVAGPSVSSGTSVASLQNLQQYFDSTSTKRSFSTQASDGAWTLLNGQSLLAVKIGAAGTTTGSVVLSGVTSGTATITAQAAAGTPTLTIGTTSGTAAVAVPSPLSLSATTGVVTWAGLTSGGVLYNSGTTTVASSALLASTAIMVGGGAGNPPITTNYLIDANDGLSVTSSVSFEPFWTIKNTTNDANSPLWRFEKNRAGAAVSAGDILFWLSPRGADSGSATMRDAGYHRAEVESVQATSVSGRWVWWTTNSGGTNAERLRLSSSGGLSVGTPSDPGEGLIYTNAATFMCRSKTTWNTGAAAAAGTLLNAPAAGNPTKWIPVDDNGTTRYIPAW